MTPAAQMAPSDYAVAGFQIAVAACGLWLLWRFVLSPAAPRAERRLAEWQIPPVDFACYVFFAIAGFLALSAAAGLILRHVRISADSTKVLGGAVQDVGLLLGIGGFHRFYRGRPRAADRARVGAALRSGAVTFFIAILLVDLSGLAWGYILTRLGLPMQDQDLVDIAENTSSPWLKASLVVIAVGIAPLAEELVFRAGLFRYLRTRIPRWLAIAATSALFGSLHMAWDSSLVGLPSVAPLIVLAVVFCVAYERTGSVGTVIVAHSLFNLYTFVLLAAGVRS